MPQIKKDFSAGKMNKDLDERIVPNGQYRDAMNIQVRTTNSEGGEGNAGTVQNIPGNKAILESIHYESKWGNKHDDYTSFIGSVANEKDNKAYFLIASPSVDKFMSVISDPLENPTIQQATNPKKIFIDYIVEADVSYNASDSSINPVVVDRYGFMDTKANILSDDDPPSGKYTQLTLAPGVTDNLRVGMVMRAYNYATSTPQASTQQYIHSMYTNVEPEFSQDSINSSFRDQGAEIQDINGNEILFYTEQQPVNWNQVDIITFFIPEERRALNFKQDRIVTGINIIDDLLFWTDNYNEPKRINIKKCKDGSIDFLTHTKVKLELPTDSEILLDAYDNQIEQSLSTTVNSDIEKKHVTVIRKAPLSAPVVEMSQSEREGIVTQTNVFYNFANYEGEDEDIQPGNTFTIPTEGDIAGTSSPSNDPAIFNNIQYEINDIIEFNEETTDTESWLTAKVETIDFSGDYKVITFRVLTKNKDLLYSTAITNSGYWTTTLEQSDALFELKFGRFGLRYKYEDGEYSNFGPFSEIAFLPGQFDYDYKKGYNLGMANTVRSLIIKDFIPPQRDRQVDITAIDILYKTTEGPNVYVVKTITRGIDPEWDNFSINDEFPTLAFGELNITSEMIHKTLPNNQTLRAWDNVPRTALAQEIAANRLVYANVVQGWDVNNKPSIKQHLKTYRTPSPTTPDKSIKSLRDYKVGMVFGDKYGRETPVFAATYIQQKEPGDRYSVFDGTIKVPKQFSKFKNKLELQQFWGETDEGIPDDWIHYTKYYIKETSNEYYNLVMDRWYNAEDGNIWISFPSADRNKIDEDTYLILKNEHGTDNAVAEAARYKIIAIDNEAPDFIKQQKRDMGQLLLGAFETGGESGWTDVMYSDHMWSTVNPLTQAPDRLMTSTEIAITNTKWGGFLDGYETQGDLQIRLKAVSDTTTVGSICPWRLVTYQHKFEDPDDPDLDGTGVLRWDKPFNATAMFDQLVEQFGVTPLPNITWFMEFRELVTKSQPEFEGKFFVKIERDDVLANKVLGVTDASQYYVDDTTYLVCYIDNQEYNPGVMFNDNPGPRRGYKWFNQPDLTINGTETDDLVTYGVFTDFSFTDINGNTVIQPIDSQAAFQGTDGNIGNLNVANLNNSPGINIWGSFDGWAGEHTGTGDVNYEACGNSGGGNLVSGVGCHPYDAEFLALGCTHEERDAQGTLGDELGANIPFGGGQDEPGNVMNRTKITYKFWSWFKNEASTNENGIERGNHGAKIFIDGMRTRQVVSGLPDDEPTGTYYKHTAFEEGTLSGSPSTTLDAYTFEGTEGELGAVTFSVLNNWSQDQEENSYGFREKFLTQGTRFKFNRDPNLEVYVVVSNTNTAYEMESRNTSVLPRHAHNAALSATNDDGSYAWTDFSAPEIDESPGARWWRSPWYGETGQYAINNGAYDQAKCTNALDCYAPLNFANINPKHSINSLDGFTISDVYDDSDPGSTISALTISGYADGVTTFVNVGGITHPDSGYNTTGSAWGYDNIPDENTHFTCTPCNEHIFPTGAEYFGGNTQGQVFDQADVLAEEAEAGLCVRKSIKIEFRRLDKETGQILPNKGIDTTVWDPRSQICHDGREAMGITTLKQVTIAGDIYVPPANAAIWETEPKEDVGLDIYYEASNAFPTRLTSENTSTFAPYNSPITMKSYLNGFYRDVVIDPVTQTSNSYALNEQVEISRNHRLYYIGYTKSHSVIGIKGEMYLQGQFELTTFGGGGAAGPNYWAGEESIIASDNILFNYLVFNHSDGTKTMSKVIANMEPIDANGETITVTMSNGLRTYPEITYTSETRFRECSSATGFYKIDSNVWKFPIELGWSNCFSFGNGVESDRIRDDFNANQIDNGVKASSTILDYGKEVLGSRMIYSGLYNSTSGTNNLNEFNMAEKITKDINPMYGTIQRLKTRDTDMVVLAEDKILRVQTNKDALFNADGNPQLLASNRVLGTAMPYSGDYGISKNPESMAFDQFRVYFTDMQRGAVMRLSRDGLTPISNVGMKTWFRDNLKKSKNLLGTFDIVNGEYNITLDYKDTLGIDDVTVSFNEDSKGWVSFKSFVPQTGVSVSGKYLTAISTDINKIVNGESVDKKGVFMHNEDIIIDGKVTNRNTFYKPITTTGTDFLDGRFFTNSHLVATFNEMPDVVKGFRTAHYEGSQSRIDQNTQDNEYYNLNNIDGWWVSQIQTDLSKQGEAINFKNKEGKWFQNISGGKRDTIDKEDLKEFSVQGLGKMVAGDQVESSSQTVNITIVNEEDNE